MTTQPAQRRPLSLIPPAHDTEQTAEAAVRQWDPERQLVGSLMHLNGHKVAQILGVVPDSAIWSPENRWVVEVIRHLVATGCEPDPVTVLQTARRRGPISEGTSRVSPRRHHRFAVRLADLYTQAVAPLLLPQYAREVLENAFCRAAAAHGSRLTQFAENNSARHELAECIVDMRAELADLWIRIEAMQSVFVNPRRRTGQQSDFRQGPQPRRRPR